VHRLATLKAALQSVNSELAQTRRLLKRWSGRAGLRFIREKMACPPGLQFQTRMSGASMTPLNRIRCSGFLLAQNVRRVKWEGIPEMEKE
jgi:hypothetical protein